jgi:hypothetical protein
MPDPTDRPDPQPQPPVGPTDADTRAFEPGPATDPTRAWTQGQSPGQDAYPGQQPYPPEWQPYGQGPYPPGPPYQQPPYPPQYPPPYQPQQYPPQWQYQQPGAFPPPGSLPPRRRGPGALVGVLVLLLAVAIVTAAGALYLLLSNSKPGPTPRPTSVATGTATPRPSAPGTPATNPPSTPTARPSPSPGTTPSPSPAESPQPSASTVPTATPVGSQAPASIDPQIVAQIDAIVATVPSIRGLEPKRTVPYRFITREQFAEQFRQEFAQDNPPEQLAAEEALDKRLGLLPPDADLKQLAEALYTSQVLAFYDPKIEEFTVITRPGGTFTPSDRVTVAHEYDHALQDQYWDLEKLQVADPKEGDRAFAHVSLAEGDATALMYQWAFQNLTPEEFLGLGSSATPEDQALLESMPLILKRTLTFPYLGGLEFISAEFQAGGGWDAVNAIWDSPPASTEQVIHPEKYDTGEEPVTITLPEIASTLSGHWTASSEQTVGELVTDIWLADGVDTGNGPLGPNPLPNADAAAGWGGDRVVNLDGPSGTWAVVWQTTWDTEQDAAEFSAAVPFDSLPGPTSVGGTSIAGDLPFPVLVLSASDPQTLDAVKAALGVTF